MERRLIFRISSAVLAAAFLSSITGGRPARAAPAILYARPGGLTSGICDSWVNACELRYALQYELSYGLPGDQVWVKKGLYRPTEDPAAPGATFDIEPGIEVYGGFNGTETLVSERNWRTNRTILSGDIDHNDKNADGNRVAESWAHIVGGNSAHVVTIRGYLGVKITSTTMLDGLIITAGDALPSSGAGGGLLCMGGGADHECSPTLKNLTFSGNRAQNGGAISNQGNTGGVSNPVLNNVVFRGNFASYAGGAMYNMGYDAGHGNPSLTDVTFIANQASSGGAIHNDGDSGESSPILVNVTFNANRSDDRGGAMVNSGQLSGVSSPTLTNVTFRGNTADWGGAIYNWGANTGNASPTLINVTFNGNRAFNYGGGLYSSGTAGGQSLPTLTNVILWGDTAAIDDPEISNNSATPTISYSIVQGSGGSGAWDGSLGNNGGGNLDVNPKLGTLANNGGLTQTMLLKMGSPAVNAGTNTGCPEHDQRGLARPQASLCDMGAVESRAVLVTFRSQGTADGWVLESAQGSGVGGTRNATAARIRVGDDASNRQYRTILSFNTASIPDAALIADMVIKIKHAGIVGSDPFASLGELRMDIRKGAFGIGALQNGDFQAAPDAANAGPIQAIYPDGWHTGGLYPSSLIYVNKLGVTQLRLAFTLPYSDNSQADYLECYSGNAAGADRPILIVTYMAP